QNARDVRPVPVFGKAEEGPGAFPETLDEARFRQELQVARDAWLRLPENICQIGDGQFGLGQKGQHAQACLLASHLEGTVQGIKAQRAARTHVWAISHHIKICLYVEAPVRKPGTRIYLARLTDRYG